MSDVFFFKQKTAYEIYQCDWSSDVCSSDLKMPPRVSREASAISQEIIGNQNQSLWSRFSTMIFRKSMKFEIL